MSTTVFNAWVIPANLKAVFVYVVLMSMGAPILFSGVLMKEKYLVFRYYSYKNCCVKACCSTSAQSFHALHTRGEIRRLEGTVYSEIHP